MILLRLLLIIITILTVLRLVVRLVLPMLFQAFVNKARQQGNAPNREPRRRPDGSVHVDFIPPKDKEARAADRAGDFIDYEEIR